MTVNGNTRKVFKRARSARKVCLESQWQMLSLTSSEESQPGYSLFWKMPPCCLSKAYFNHQTLESAKIVQKSLEKQDLLLTKPIILLLAFDYDRKTSKPSFVFLFSGFLHSSLWSSGPEGTCKPSPTGMPAAAAAGPAPQCLPFAS